MKKLLLLSCCLFAFMLTRAQVIVYCEEPASIAGNNAFTIADPAGGWGCPDMTIPSNAVRDTVMMVDDGSSADSLGCNPLINDLTGKIAFVYRGACEFGVKAKNAQDAGAVAVIIVNHSGDPVGMGPGAQGANVTIPVVMISTADGAKVLAELDANKDVVYFIGNKKGLFANDIGFLAIDALTSRATANPKLVSQNATEFNVPMGAWVHNYGTQVQTAVKLNAYISGAATYSATSATPVNLNVNDSAYIALPTYSASSYSGFYKVYYVASASAADDFSADNKFYSSFHIDSLASYAFFDSVTAKPVSKAHYRMSTPPSVYKTCMHFRDANASRLGAMGLWFSASGGPGGDLTLETIDAELYEWNDNFTGFSDPNMPGTTGWTLALVGSGAYTYNANTQNTMVYAPFATPVALKNNQRYLFCASTFSADIFLGFDSYYDYTEVINANDQPVSIVIADADHYAAGFGTDVTVSVTPQFGAFDVSVGEHGNSFNVTPYPNPAVNFITIPLKGMNGNAALKIMDLSGKVVSVQNVKVAGNVNVNVTDIASGQYVFNMVFEDGSHTTFNVVVTK